MKYSILFILFYLISICNYGQYDELVDKKEKKQIIKKQKIEERKRQIQNDIELTEKLLKLQRFILKTDKLSNNRGEQVYVNNTSNFIIIDSISVIIQTSSNFGLGYNGIGGITIDGTITKYELKERIRKNLRMYNISCVLISSIGIFDIYFTISETGNAYANISGITSGNITFHGKLYDLKKSKAYIGNSIL